LVSSRYSGIIFIMDFTPGDITRISPLQPLDTPGLSGRISVSRAEYSRQLPRHYLGNALARQTMEIHVIRVQGGMLASPAQPQTTFEPFYRELQQVNPPLFRRVLSPSGTAKTAADEVMTPIKEIAGMHLAGISLPGDAELYGWHALNAETARRGADLQVLFQGNGLYYNRGSAFYDGHSLLAFPDQFLADYLEGGAPAEVRQRLAVDDHSLNRPLLFFVTGEDGRMSPYLHRFRKGEIYSEGMNRLQETFRARRVRAALSASPHLVLPGQDGKPFYLKPSEILRSYHANDVRHSLYCPYVGAAMLAAEFSRAHCLLPASLAASLSGRERDRIFLRLRETLKFFSPAELPRFLDEKGYAGRYSISGTSTVMLWINPLEGIYSYLIPFLTRSGQFGLLQTSGTHGNVTGNDGPTQRQLIAILRDVNSQPPFDADPIIAASSGSQGNDVPNIVCRGSAGEPGLLHVLAPNAAFETSPALRGIVTTPRAGIVTGY
jgi:hypothetical protein